MSWPIRSALCLTLLAAACGGLREKPLTPPRPDAGLPTGQLVIDGVPIAKDKALVFLHIGHSNMAGRTDSPVALRSLSFESHPRLWSFAKGGVWRPAKEPLTADHLTQGRAGPGMSILRTALEAAAPDTYVISIGHGRDGSIGGYCKSFRKGGLLYDLTMGPAIELKGRVTFAGIFTMLGVNEFRRDPDNLPRFNQCLEAIANEMRSDLEDPTIPVLFGDLEAGATGDFAPSHSYSVTAREQLRIAAANLQRAAVIPTELLPMADDHHFDLTGYKLWAERGFALMTKQGWAPWAPSK